MIKCFLKVNKFETVFFRPNITKSTKIINHLNFENGFVTDADRNKIVVFLFLL